MRDVEELLRDTLADPRRRVDPTGGTYETVSRRARALRHKRWAFASAATAVVAVVASATTIAANGASHRARPGNQTSIGPTTSASPQRGSVAGAVDVGQGWPSNAVMAADGLFVVTNNPSQLVELNTAGTEIKATVDLPSSNMAGVAVGDGRVWAWSQDPAALYAYDLNTLQPLGWYTTAGQLFNVVALDGDVYITTDHGLLKANADQPKSGALSAARVAGVDGGTYGLAADPDRHRVLVGAMPLSPTPTNTFAGVRVVAVDTRTGKVVAESAQTSVGKESIAVVGDQVWVGGYGDVDKPRLEHLDAATLKVVGTSPAGDDVGPGAILWPGVDVLWVRNGGDEGLSCVDPKTGAILEQWLAVQGPVVSSAGHAFGIQAGLQPLRLSGGCTG